MKQYEFGYFPRNKYKDLVFYVKTGEHSNMGLFEMDDTEENRAIMDALLPHPYQSERDKVLDRLDKEIHIREDEMNRKAGLEENLVTISGYYASAGALNWVRKVLIDGSRETIRQAGEQ